MSPGPIAPVELADDQILALESARARKLPRHRGRRRSHRHRVPGRAAHVADLEGTAIRRLGDHPRQLAGAADGLAVHRHDDVLLLQAGLAGDRVGRHLTHEGTRDALEPGGLGLLGRHVPGAHADPRPSARAWRHVRHVLHGVVHDDLDVHVPDGVLGGARRVLDDASNVDAELPIRAGRPGRGRS